MDGWFLSTSYAGEVSGNSVFSTNKQHGLTERIQTFFDGILAVVGVCTVGWRVWIVASTSTHSTWKVVCITTLLPSSWCCCC